MNVDCVLVIVCSQRLVYLQCASKWERPIAYCRFHAICTSKILGIDWSASVMQHNIDIVECACFIPHSEQLKVEPASLGIAAHSLINTSIVETVLCRKWYEYNEQKSAEEELVREYTGMAASF